jgi:hypothetical protein
MKLVKKEEIIRILEDLKENICLWDWDEDYHGSGLEDREDRIEWSKERIQYAISIINNNNGEYQYDTKHWLI